MAGLIPFNRNKSLFNTNRFDDFYNVMDDFFNDMLPSRFLMNDTFKIDVMESEKEYLVEAELPGIKKEDISLELVEGRLTIEVICEDSIEDKKNNYIHKERKIGAMKRSIYLQDIASEGICAKFDNGLLKINIPKISKEENSYKIDIK